MLVRGILHVNSCTAFFGSGEAHLSFDVVHFVSRCRESRCNLLKSLTNI